MLSDIEDKAKEDMVLIVVGPSKDICSNSVIQEGTQYVVNQHCLKGSKYLTHYNLPEGWYLNDMEAKL